MHVKHGGESRLLQCLPVTAQTMLPPSLQVSVGQAPEGDFCEDMAVLRAPEEGAELTLENARIDDMLLCEVEDCPREAESDEEEGRDDAVETDDRPERDDVDNDERDDALESDEPPESADLDVDELPGGTLQPASMAI